MTPIFLSGSLDQYAAEPLRDQVLALMKMDGEVKLDLREVEHIDTCALQVLLALQQGLAKQNRTLTITGASESVRNWFRVAGAEQIFNFADGDC